MSIHKVIGAILGLIALLAPVSCSLLPGGTEAPTPTAAVPTSAPTSAPVTVTLETATATQAPTATATPLPASPSLAVRAPDGTLKLVSLGGIQLNSGLPLGGLPPRGGRAGGALYALSFGPTDTKAIVVDAAGERPLDFIPSPGFALAVWPGDGQRAAQLAWDAGTYGPQTESQLFVAGPDGAQVKSVLQVPISGDLPVHLVPQRWSRNGQILYFSREPFGLGGYILFDGASSLYALNPEDGSVRGLIPFDAQSIRAICIDDLSPDERMTADHCNPQAITIRDLANGATAEIQPPTDGSTLGPSAADVVHFQLIGSARFSPDGSRVAFALARGDSENEQGWVAVSEGLSDGSRLIAASQPHDYFTVAGWLNENTLLLQSYGAAPGVWEVNAESGDSVRLADGTFLGLVGP